MRLTDEMRKLTDHLREAHEARAEAVVAIRTGAIQGLAELHAARREMSAALRERLHAAERARRAEAAEAARHRARDVDSLRASTASMLKELADDMAGAHEVWAELARRARPTPAELAAAPILRAGRKGRLFRRRG